MLPSSRSGLISAGTEAAAVVVADLGAPPDEGLDELLGAGGAQRLREELRGRARRWAAGVSGDQAYEATSISAALAAVHGHAGPLLLGAPDVPALDARLAGIALADIAAGCDLSIGLAHDSRPYLIAVARPEESLVAIGARGFEGGLLPAFAEHDVVVGMLAPHRRLTSAADARAFALDPMTDAALAGLLETLRAS